MITRTTLLGIVGPRNLAIKTQKTVDRFLKSDLHIKIKKNSIINQNEGKIKFLGFIIYLSHFTKKTQTKYNQFVSIAKYKKKMTAKLKMSNAHLAKNAVFNIKKNLLKAFNNKLTNKK